MTVTLTEGGDYLGPTSGDVVIAVVGGKYSQVTTYGGNDAICVLGTASIDRISTGSGDDYVNTSELVSAPHASNQIGYPDPLDVMVNLEDGDDTFVGGAAFEVVRGGGGSNSMSTGAGNDIVSSDNYATTSADGVDVIFAGAGDDVVGTRKSAVVDLGDGADSLDVVGPLVRATGGTGTDSISVGSANQRASAVVNLAAGTYSVGADLQALVGFEDVATRSFQAVRVVGDTGPNHISIEGCIATVNSASGADSVVLSLDSCRTKSKRLARTFKPLSFIVNGGAGPDRVDVETSGKASISGGAGRDVLKGGKSADVLNGGSGSDRLIGGRQYDIARGGRGQDTCVAERRLSC